MASSSSAWACCCRCRRLACSISSSGGSGGGDTGHASYNEAVEREDLRAFVGSDWTRASEAKLEYWADRFQREGGGPARRASTMLLEHARRLGMSPLNKADRAADLAHHERLCELLDCAGPAFTSR